MSIFEDKDDGHIKTAFKVAATAAVTPVLALLDGAVGSLLSRVSVKLRPGKGRLREGEHALVKSIFGNEINTKRIRIYFNKYEPDERILACTFGPRKIAFQDPENYEADYSQTRNVTNYESFMHEMMHIRQNQHIIPRAVSSLCSIYQRLRDPRYVYTYSLWNNKAALTVKILV